MPFFDTFASPRWSPLRMRTKVVPFFIFSKSFQTKKIEALRPKMTKIASCPTNSNVNAKDYFTGYARFHGNSIIGASLKRAPQLRVDLAFCHDIYIYIYIYIDRPTSVIDPAPGVKVGCCGPNLRVVTLCENDLLYWYMHVPSHSSSNSSLIELVRV